MSHPTSLRLPDAVKAGLDAQADARGETVASIAVRLLDEGLRMAAHPGIAFHDSVAHGRVACVAGGPDVAEVVDVLTGLEATGEERLVEAASWLSLHPSQVRAALEYHAAFSDEVEAQRRRRAAIAAEERGRYEATRSLLE